MKIRMALNNKSYLAGSSLIVGAVVTVSRGDLLSGAGLLGPGSGGSRLCCPHCIIPCQGVVVVNSCDSVTLAAALLVISTFDRKP